LRPFYSKKDLAFDHFEIPKLSIPRKNCASFISGKFIFVIGGKTYENERLFIVEFCKLDDLISFFGNRSKY
jgi:hypothetical protein